MSDALSDALLRDALRHPLAAAVLIAVGLRALSAAMGWSTARLTSAASLAARAVAALALVTFAVGAAYYAWSPHYFDVAEPTVPAVGWMYHLGHPIYHGAVDANRYSHVWGPLVFMVHGGVLGLVGPSIGASKAIGPIAAALALALLWWTLRRARGAAMAWTGTGLTAAVLLAFRHYSFWTRPEPLQLLCVTIGLAALEATAPIAALAIGISQGLLWNLKLTGPLYGAPILAALFVARGWRVTGFAIVTAVLVAAAPFMVDPRVSLADYLFWFGASSRSGIEPRLLLLNVEWLGVLLAPIALAWRLRERDAARAPGSDRLVVAAVAAGLVGVALAASKPGAGAYHLMAFAPIAAVIVARTNGARFTSANIPVAMLALVVVVGGIAAFQQVAWLTTMIGRESRDEAGDLKAFVASHTARVEMAYGADEPATLARPILVFRSGLYLVDQPAVREHQLNGIALPPATITAVRACQADYWLIPRGDDPWTGRNTYPMVLGQPLYPAAMREVFLESYERNGETRYFDVWRCRARRLP